MLVDAVMGVLTTTNGSDSSVAGKTGVTRRSSLAFSRKGARVERMKDRDAFTLRVSKKRFSKIKVTYINGL